MDTSEQYIKMCDCPEIQNGHKPEFGDYFRLIDGVVICESGDLSIKYECDYGSNPIWLPRQDQLQEMMKYGFKHELDINLARYFHAWLINKPNQITDASMEQLWLAFYMHEKHGKIWNGEKWVGIHIKGKSIIEGMPFTINLGGGKKITL